MKYINKDNLNYFVELFDNYDIFEELYCLLPYDIASCHPKFNNLKKLWIIKNINKSFRYFDEFKEFLVYSTEMTNYYLIDNKLYYDSNIIFMSYDLRYIYDNINKIISNEYKNDYKLFYVMNKNIFFNLITQMYEILYNKLYKKDNNYCFGILSENISLSIMINNLELMKYFVEHGKSINIFPEEYIKKFFIDKHIDKPIINNNLDIIEYMVNNFEIKLDNALTIAVNNDKIDIIKFVLSKNPYIDCENLMMQ